jgi:hypothetical protein
MAFQLRPEDTREAKYPNAQDIDFLGFDRPNDRWKVDASGIKLYASGISVELDKDEDSVSVWSASGTPVVPTYLERARYDTNGNQYVLDAGALVPKEYDYIELSYTGSNATGVTYKKGGPSGTVVALLSLTYDGSDNLTSVARS